MDNSEERNTQSRRSSDFAVSDPNSESKGLAPEVRERLRKAVHDAGGNKAVAARAAIPISTLNDALAGTRNPRATAIAAIAQAVGRSLDWIFFGEEAQEPAQREPESDVPGGVSGAAPGVHEDLLRQAILLVEEWLDKNGRTMSPDKRAHVVTMIYQFAIEDAPMGTPSIDTRRVGQFLRLVR